MIFDSNLPFKIKENYKELSLLNKKSFLKNNDEDSSQLNRNIDKIIESKIKTLSQIKDNNYSNFIKLFAKNSMNVHNNLYKIENADCLFIDKSIPKEIQLNKDFKEEILSNIKENNLNNTDNKPNVISNEIMVKKNNKMVFMNKNLIKPKIKKKDILEKKKRKSIYRGVSKNGKKWQTIIISNKKNEYYGVFPTEEIAARVYDIVQLKKKGIKAKTNFQYNIHQIQNIIDASIDFKSNDINNNIINLIED